MENTIIIGISGKMRSGKTTLAHRLKEHFDNSQVYSFADAVRREVASAICDTAEERKAWDSLLINDKEKARILLQGWGGTKRVLFGKDYWLKKTFDAINLCGYDIVIIDDVRYWNEMIHVNKRGMCIRLECDTHELCERGATPEGLSHESERDLNYTHFEQHIDTHKLNEYDTFIEALRMIEAKGILE